MNYPRYIQTSKTGWHLNSVRYQRSEGAATEAVCTCTYNPGSHEDKEAMARRITAALNATRQLTTEQIEELAARVAA